MTEYSAGDREFMKRIFGYRFKDMKDVIVNNCFGVHVLYLRNTDIQQLVNNCYEIMKCASLNESSVILTLRKTKLVKNTFNIS